MANAAHLIANMNRTLEQVRRRLVDRFAASGDSELALLFGQGVVSSGADPPDAGWVYGKITFHSGLFSLFDRTGNVQLSALYCRGWGISDIDTLATEMEDLAKRAIQENRLYRLTAEPPNVRCRICYRLLPISRHSEGIVSYDCIFCRTCNSGFCEHCFGNHASFLHGRPPSLKGNTTFKLSGYGHAKIVALAGTFNGWGQSPIFFGKEGDDWVCRADVPPGRHFYKFVIDGRWVTDPGNAVTESDRHGNVNSVLLKGR